MIKPIKYFFEAVIIYSLFLIAKIIGLSLSRKVFAFIFQKVGPLIRSNTSINKNLLKYSDNLTLQERTKIISNMWSNYGMTFVEYIFLTIFKKKKSHIQIEGEEILEEIFNSGKPVIFISGHFANFELMSMEIARKKINLATIYRPLNNFFLNPLMEYLRRKYVCKNQIKKGLGGVKDTIEYINNKYSIALMVDQRVSEGERVKFFNTKALTTTLPGQLALKYNLSLVPIFIERKNDNSFKMKVYNPIKNTNFKNKFEITEKLNQIIENMIIENPNQWIWTHDRWK
tara:strand:+ start:5171 stop:6028 length:858 start_codon:yes stop_codon:yes gene_type:complete